MNATKKPNETATEYSTRIAREASERNAAIGTSGVNHYPVAYRNALTAAGIDADDVIGCEKKTDNGGYRIITRDGITRDIS